MTRLASVCITIVFALASQASLTLARPQQPPAASVPTTSCTIATPSRPLIKGQPYKIEFANCKGPGSILLRYGSEDDLATDKVPACATMDLAAGSCMFTPSRSGPFTFSTTDAAGETFSGDFTVADSSNPQSVAAQDAKVMTTKKAQPVTMARKAQKSAPAVIKKRALYNMAELAAM
ncbi:hypothetical protein BGZ70_006113 [Mortierella alpina]|uniref:Uncharacterized protein n=1 Tax=Mortierella alpina TaxID=64518 RepID=A0A9P6JBM7_MORAP|nr:hypothetical protein BGZ70_006113 [Mortierella alpina]